MASPLALAPLQDGLLLLPFSSIQHSRMDGSDVEQLAVLRDRRKVINARKALAKQKADKECGVAFIGLLLANLARPNLGARDWKK